MPIVGTRGGNEQRSLQGFSSGRTIDPLDQKGAQSRSLNPVGPRTIPLADGHRVLSKLLSVLKTLPYRLSSAGEGFWTQLISSQRYGTILLWGLDSPCLLMFSV